MILDTRVPQELTFTVSNADGEISTENFGVYRGKYGDFTFVCASEVPGINKKYSEFQNRNCAVLSCSTDSAHCHNAWKKLPPSEGGIGPIEYPMIADNDHSISKFFDTFRASGESCRATIIIDPNGLVIHSSYYDNPVGRDADEILRFIDGHQFFVETAKSGAVQVCPLGWKKGALAMKPTITGVAEFNQETAN